MPKYKKEDYKYKTLPYLHQEVVFKQSRDKEEFALLMDMGTGKTKVIIDTASWLYSQGRIRAMLVISPNGLQANWEGEIETHMPDYIDRTVRIYSSRDNTKKYQKYMSDLGKGDDLKIMLMNVEAMATKKGQAYATKFTRIYPTLTVVDESTRIKNPKAKRTKAAVKIGHASAFKRILSGQPITQSPLDLYSQFDFLGPHILGFSSYYSFKHRYAITVKRSSKRGGKEWFYEEIIDFTNMDELKEKLKPYSYRVEKYDCLDLPDKVYTQLRTTLSPEQKRLYKEMKEMFVAELESGEVITAPMALVRLLRLQQILGGFINDQLGNSHSITGSNSKLECLLYDLEDVPEGTSVIIWARFRKEIEAIAGALRNVYGHNSCGIYYGGIDTDTRAQLVKDFQTKKVRFFIGSPAAAGMGLTLTAASLVYYFSNDFSLENRIQSEDRCHRIGQVNKVVYKDIVIPGTVDMHVLKAIKDKTDLASSITGDLKAYKSILKGDF